MSPTAVSVLHGVAETESGHDYSAVGKLTSSGHRAYGKYQVMGYNIPNWTDTYLGVRMTVQEFLHDHHAQDMLAGLMFTERIGKYRNIVDPVAIWFSGQPAHGNENCDINGTCVPEYIAQTLALRK